MEYLQGYVDLNHDAVVTVKSSDRGEVLSVAF